MSEYQYKPEAQASVPMWWERHTRLRFGLVLLIVIQNLVCFTTVLGDEDDLRLAAGLRERRLFDHAEFVCRQALSDLVDSKGGGREQVAFVVELIRIRSEQARFAPPEQRETFRLAARAVGEQFLSDYPQHPRRVIIQLQTVLIDSELVNLIGHCLLYTSPSPRDKRQSRMPSSA